MVEPEIAFIDLNQLTQVIEVFIKDVVKEVCSKCTDEFAFFEKEHDFLKNRIDQILNSSFIRVEYTTAIEQLKDAINRGHQFEDNDIFFGKDLAAEHERYLCEVIYQSPIFLINYPKEIKAFYMKQNNDDKTVAACDLLVPGVGEIVGGSQREDDYEKLINRCQSLQMDVSTIQ